VQRVLIADRYRLLHTVGSGGMGRVWLARDEMLHRDVAIKEILPPDWMTPAERDDLRQRTLREARTAARLNHPNVVKIWDVVYAEGSPWIVMEYVPSRSLHEIVEADGPLPPQRVAEIGLRVLEALVAAHRARVLHRDVKPHNVLIADDGRVVLTDFGLATIDGDSAVTRQGMVMGSPQYVAPERARDGDSTAEADMWSLGATLYAAVEGRSPFARPTTLATLTALVTSPPDPPQRAGPLRPVLAGLLRKEPRQRFTAPEVDRLLHRVLDPTVKARPRLLPRARRAIEAPPGEGPTVVLDGDVPGPRPVGGSRRPGWSRRRLAVLATAVGLLVLTAFGTSWAMNRNDSKGNRANPPAAGGGVAGSSGAPSATAMRAAVVPCGSVNQAATVEVAKGPDPSAAPYKLLDDWTYYVDPSGYWIGVPIGWRHWTASRLQCFGDVRGGRVLSVDQLPSKVASPMDHWKTEEKRLLDQKLVTNFRRLKLDLQTLHGGGAVWEFTYTEPESSDRKHAVRMLYNVGKTAYVITYATDADQWNSEWMVYIQTSFDAPD
jgi:serine/threonine protein kinase